MSNVAAVRGGVGTFASHDSSEVYTVRSGDTLSAIAASHGVSLAALEAANPQIRNPNLILPGEHINIPAGGASDQHSGTQTYTVRSGDTLSAIGERFGVSWQVLAQVNHLANPNLIRPGEKLQISGAGTSGTSATSSDTTQGTGGGGVGTTQGRSPVRGNLTMGRTDEGVDWSGTGQVVAVGSGTIINTTNAGWPGGTYIVLRLDNHAGLPSSDVYYAEDINATVSVGQHVNAGEVLGQAYGGPSGIEIGWGNPNAVGASLSGPGTGTGPTKWGQNFLDWIQGKSPAGGSSGGKQPVSSSGSQGSQATSGTTYTVRSGDTLSAIAASHGVSLAALEAANPQISNPNLIHPGQHINIPAGGSSSGKQPVSSPGSQGPQPANGATPATLQARINAAMAYFQSQGWTRAQAAGIVANLEYESGYTLDPHKPQDGGGPGYGLAQWEGPRQASFARWAGHDIHSATFNEELQFVQWELTHTESGAGNALRGATNAADAAEIVLLDYEAPKNPAASSQERKDLAQQIYNGSAP